MFNGGNDKITQVLSVLKEALPALVTLLEDFSTSDDLHRATLSLAKGAKSLQDNLTGEGFSKDEATMIVAALFGKKS